MAIIIKITNREICNNGRLMMRIKVAEAHIECSDTILTLDLSLIQDVKIDEREIRESEDRAEESLLFTLNLNFISYMFIYLAGMYK